MYYNNYKTCNSTKIVGFNYFKYYSDGSRIYWDATVWLENLTHTKGIQYSHKHVKKVASLIDKAKLKSFRWNQINLEEYKSDFYIEG